MGVVWTAPAALWALALLAVPLVLHLLQRPRVPRIAVPSLRFVPRTPLAAARRRVLHDLPLLAVRLLVVAVAVAALAGPVVVTGARERAWAGRVARAVIVDRSESMRRPPGVARANEAVEAERGGAFAAAVFEATTPAAAVPAAVRWLDAQPPAAREMVIVTDAQHGALGPTAFAEVPHGVGIRIRPLVLAEAAPEILRLVSTVAGRPAGARVPLDLTAAAAVASTGTGPPVRADLPRPPVTLVADGDAGRLVEAIWAGLLDEGVRVRASESWLPVTVRWGSPVVAPVASADPIGRAAAWRIARALALEGHVGVQAETPAPWLAAGVDAMVAGDGRGVAVHVHRAPEVERDQRLLRLVREVAIAQDHVAELEPLPMAPEARTALERPAGPAALGAIRRVEPTDARWCWAVVLLLLGVEAALRRWPAGGRSDVRTAQEARHVA